MLESVINKYLNKMVVYQSSKASSIDISPPIFVRADGVGWLMTTASSEIMSSSARELMSICESIANTTFSPPRPAPPSCKVSSPISSSPSESSSWISEVLSCTRTSLSELETPVWSFSRRALSIFRNLTAGRYRSFLLVGAVVSFSMTY